MSIFVWSSAPSKIYVWGTQVSKVFVGDNQVRPVTPPSLERPNLDTYSLTNIVTLPSSYFSRAHAICTSTDGKYIYLTSRANNAYLRSFYLSDGSLNTYTWNVDSSTTGTFNSRWLFFRDKNNIYSLTDGTSTGFTKIYMATAYQLSSATISSPSINITDTAKVWCEFSPDWMYFYRSVQSQGKIRQYSLSAPYDLSNSTLVYELSVSSVVPSPYDVRLSPTGLKMFISRRDGSIWWIYQWNLSTPFMIGTAIYSNKYISWRECTFDVTESGRIFAYFWGNTISQYDSISNNTNS